MTYRVDSKVGMNSITQLALIEAYGYKDADPNKAIAVTYPAGIKCRHEAPVQIYADGSLLESTSIDYETISLTKYALGNLFTYIGRCPECRKVYYLK